MDWTQIITELGGGLSAVVIAALGFVCWKLWQWGAAAQTSRIDDQKEHTGQIIESIRTLDAAISAIKDMGGRRD